ncbi:MAG: hypothetical protein KDB18_10010 [Salinibacterium sp.]|nr:hypothetical protein [Salinibacterium sp.]
MVRFITHWLLVVLLATTLSAQTIRVRHPSGMEGAARRIEREYPELLALAETKLGLKYGEPLEVVLTRDHDDFQEAVREAGGQPRPEFVAAVAFPHRDLIILKSAAWTRGESGSAREIFLHEIVHCVLGAAERLHRRRVPTWLHEGLAQWVSDRPFRGTPAALESAIQNDRLIPFEDLVRDFPDQEGASELAYAQALGLVRFLDDYGGGHERGNVRVVLRLILLGDDFASAIRTLTGLEPAAFEQIWKGQLRQAAPSILANFAPYIYSGTLFILLVLAYATHRARRARRLHQLELDESLDLVEVSESVDL